MPGRPRPAACARARARARARSARAARPRCAAASASSRSKRCPSESSRIAAATSRVVDGVVDAVVGAAVADLELDVEEEELPEPLLLLLDTVVAEDARGRRARRSSRPPPSPPRAPRRARARRGRAGSTRRARRPRPPPPTDAAAEATVAFGSPVSLPERALAREPDEQRPADRGELVEPADELEVVRDRLAEADARDRGRRAPRGCPRATANASRSSRKRFTSETTSS